MWTLILFTMVVGIAGNGGVHSTTTAIRFDKEAQCQAALERLTSDQRPEIYDQTFNKVVGVFRIAGRCIADTK